MNIVVKKISENSSQVIINARYVYSSDFTDTNGRSINNDTWVFNTGECKEVFVSNPTKGTPPSRTICPTYKAENAILNALK